MKLCIGDLLEKYFTAEFGDNRTSRFVMDFSDIFVDRHIADYYLTHKWDTFDNMQITYYVDTKKFFISYDTLGGGLEVPAEYIQDIIELNLKEKLEG